MVLYDAHLDSCEGDNDDFNFELVVADGSEAVDPMDDIGGNKINIMNVIKSELSDDISHNQPLLVHAQHQQDGQQHILHHDLHNDDALSEPAQYLDEQLLSDKIEQM